MTAERLTLCGSVSSVIWKKKNPSTGKYWGFRETRVAVSTDHWASYDVNFGQVKRFLRSQLCYQPITARLCDQQPGVGGVDLDFLAQAVNMRL